MLLLVHLRIEVLFGGKVNVRFVLSCIGVSHFDIHRVGWMQNCCRLELFLVVSSLSFPLTVIFAKLLRFLSFIGLLSLGNLKCLVYSF